MIPLVGAPELIRAILAFLSGGGRRRSSTGRKKRDFMRSEFEIGGVAFRRVHIGPLPTSVQFSHGLVYEPVSVCRESSHALMIATDRMRERAASAIRPLADELSYHGGNSLPTWIADLSTTMASALGSSSGFQMIRTRATTARRRMGRDLCAPTMGSARAVAPK